MYLSRVSRTKEGKQLGRKAIWVTISLVMAASLVLVSCGQQGTTTPPTTAPGQVTTTAPPGGTTTAPPLPSGKPKYGGTLTLFTGVNFSISGAAFSIRPGGPPGLGEQITTRDRTGSGGGGGPAAFVISSHMPG